MLEHQGVVGGPSLEVGTLVKPNLLLLVYGKMCFGFNLWVLLCPTYFTVIVFKFEVDGNLNSSKSISGPSALICILLLKGLWVIIQVTSLELLWVSHHCLLNGAVFGFPKSGRTCQI